MTQLKICSHLTYSVSTPTSFAFSVIAARTPFQSVASESIDVVTEGDAPWMLVPYGAGTHQLLRLSAEPGELEITYRAEVMLNGLSSEATELEEMAFADVPAEILPYLNPSRYCESDKLGGFAHREFGDLEPGHSRVQTVSDWVTDNLVYEPGSTNSSSSTTDVLLQRAGVCRDFAHVAIALCRALGIPARYVSGYGVGVEPQDFHGFFEAYIGTDWYLFDPTGMAPANTLARIGYGRDAADAPFATLVGRAMLRSKTVEVEAIDPPSTEPEAMSTA